MKRFVRMICLLLAVLLLPCAALGEEDVFLFGDSAERETAEASAETAAEEANTTKEASTAAPTEKTTKGKNNHVNVSAAGFIWPVPGYTQLSSPYSTQYKRISIKADFGAKVVACASGRITKLYTNEYDSPCAVLTCDNGYVIEYSAAKFSVKQGEYVSRGDDMGFIGKYGTGPHLNISATKDGVSVDPATIIKP